MCHGSIGRRGERKSSHGAVGCRGAHPLQQQPLALIVAERRVAKVPLQVPELAVEGLVNGLAQLLRVTGDRAAGDASG